MATYILDFYNCFIKRYVEYYIPFKDIYIYDNTTTFVKHCSYFKYALLCMLNVVNKYQKITTNNYHSYILNIKNIEYDQKRKKYVDFGNYYHTTDEPLLFIPKQKIVIFEEPITKIKLKMANVQNNNKYDKMLDSMECANNKLNFIDQILACATSTSKIEILLYYYLRTKTNNADNILKIEFETEIEDNETTVEIELKDSIEKIEARIFGKK